MDDSEKQMLKKYRCILDLVAQCCDCIRRFKDFSQEDFDYKNQLRAIFIPHYHLFYKEIYKKSASHLNLLKKGSNTYFKFMGNEIKIEEHKDVRKEDKIPKGKKVVYFIALSIKNIIDCMENPDSDDYWKFRSIPKPKEERKQVVFTCPATNITPIIKVVGENCNIKCTYCYYNDKNQHYNSEQVMSYSVLELFISEYLELFSGDVDFVWHGGEPLLAGIDFYYKVLEIQQQYKKEHHNICNAIQTNGILINEQWAEFFKINDFRISISLDGIDECHNYFRKDNSGNGTFKKVVDSIALLRRFYIEPNILQVVTKSLIAYITDNFNFFVKDLNLKKFGICVFKDIEGTNLVMKDESLSNQDYFNLYKTIFDLWIDRDDPELVIRELDNFIFGIMGKQTTTCVASGTCTAFITVSWDGTIIPSCDNLVPVSFPIGENIKNVHLIEILNSQKRLDFAAKINDFPLKCKECEWFFACFNGCTYHRTDSVNGKNTYCEGQKKVFSYIRDKLNSIEATS